MRCNDKGRTDDIVRAVNEWRAYDFDVEISTARHLGHKGGYILEHVVSKHCLNQENVVVALDCFEDTEIIDISVTVEIQV